MAVDSVSNTSLGKAAPRPRPTPSRTHPAEPVAAGNRPIKMFTVELSAQGETALPMGWTPFAVHTLPGTTGVPRALIWAYRA